MRLRTMVRSYSVWSWDSRRVNGRNRVLCVPAMAQEEVKTDELSRKPKTKVSPVYPDVARRMSITGTVKLAVVVAPNGTVKSSKPVAGIRSWSMPPWMP